MPVHYLISYQLICLGLLILAAIFGGRLCRHFNINEEIGQLLGGLVVGPYFLNLFNFSNKFYQQSFENFKFFAFALLSLIAFSIGEELHIKRILKAGRAPIIIAGTQAVITALIIFITFQFLEFNTLDSAIIALLGISTAPAAIFILLKKYNIEGQLKSVLTNVLVLCDIIEIILFSVALEIKTMIYIKKKPYDIGSLVPAIANEILISVSIAVVLFMLLKIFVKKEKFKESAESSRELPGFNFFLSIFQVSASPSIHTFLTIFGALTLCMGISLYLKLPFLIIAVLSGFLLANFHSFDLFDSLKISNIMQMLNLFFFAFIGAIIEIDKIDMVALKYILFYVVARTAGKLIGTWCGCILADQDKKIKKIMPMMMLPQAGVPAIEAFYLYLLFGKEGKMVFNIILPSIIFFEIAGIIMSEHSLRKWKSWIVGVEKIFKTKQQTPAVDTRPLKKSLNKKLIKIPLVSRTKEKVVYELLDLFKNEGVIRETKPLHNEIMEREKLSTTGFGNGVAVPHIRTNLVSKITVAAGIAISGETVDFNSIDNKPCNIFFMILSPDDEHNEHLAMLGIISFILNQQDYRDKISKFTTVDEFYNFLRSL